MTMMADLSNFHFLRPLWLLAFLPLLVLVWLMWRRRALSRSWQSVVDARLLPHLLIGANARQGSAPLFAIAIGGILAITALAGPAWRKLEQPVFSQQSSLVVALDYPARWMLPTSSPAACSVRN